MIPKEWMPAAKMDRIISHWSGGTHKANSGDKEHYHFLREGDGTLVRGKWPVTANEKIVKGKYAAHTLNCNTGSIGHSMCAMGGEGVQEEPFKAGQWPLTETQWDATMGDLADLCIAYSIPVTPKTVLTHAEVAANLGIPQRGKWDITRLPFLPNVKGAKAVGDLMRAEVTAELARRKPAERPSVVVHAEERPTPTPKPPLVILPAGGASQPDVEPTPKPVPTTTGTAAQAGGAAAAGAGAIGLLAYNWKIGVAVLGVLAVVGLVVWLVRR